VHIGKKYQANNHKKPVSNLTLFITSARIHGQDLDAAFEDSKPQ